MNVVTRYALRSLLRSRTRTMLSVIGVAIGSALAVISTSWVKGRGDLIVQAAASSGGGHLQFVPVGWDKQRDSRLRISSREAEMLERVRALPEVAAATPHAKAEGLLALGNKIQSVSLTGVVPGTERLMTRYLGALSRGRYLNAEDRESVVLGAEICRRLRADVGDELVVSAAGPGGDVQSSLLTVVGVVDTGSRAMDTTIAHVPLALAIQLSGRAGVNHIAVKVKEGRTIPDVHQAMVKIAGPDAVALTWMEVTPELARGVKTGESFSRIISGVVMFLVLLGVTSAQLTSVLQRGREFSVLTALGMRQGPLVRLVLTESILIGVAGSILSFVLAGPIVYYLSTTGVNLAAVVGKEGLSMNGFLMDPVLRADAGPWIVPYALGLSVVATLGAAIYPAYFTRRIDPNEALRGRG